MGIHAKNGVRSWDKFNSTLMAKSLFNLENQCYKVAFIKEIRAIYFENMAQVTFVSLFTDEHLENLKVLGFTNFRGYQNSAVVKYIIEEVGRISPKES